MLGKQIRCLGCGTLAQVTASGAASPVLREQPASAPHTEEPTRRSVLQLGVGGLLLAGLVVGGGFVGASLARWRPRPSRQPPAGGASEDRPKGPGKGPPGAGKKGRGGKRGRPGGGGPGGGAPGGNNKPLT
jgi:hypothetical protein